MGNDYDWFSALSLSALCVSIHPSKLLVFSQVCLTEQPFLDKELWYDYAAGHIYKTELKLLLQLVLTLINEFSILWLCWLFVSNQFILFIQAGIFLII
jgi:hypothetical protein